MHPIDSELEFHSFRILDHQNHIVHEWFFSFSRSSLKFSFYFKSLSPDHQIEELLKKGSSGNDEISEKYLRINGRYITDGQVFFLNLTFFLYLQSL